MTYSEYSAYLAKYGFITNPVSAEEYEKLQTVNAKFPAHDIAFGVACDMNAGLSFETALLVNTPA